jgi:hypothetical protein
MNDTFQMVYALLMWIAEATGFTYDEVNIIAYYIVLPFAYVVLADRILKKNVLKVVYVVGVMICLLLIEDFTRFSDWLFMKSVEFLLSFQILGWNYIVSSVLICVVFPAIVLGVMLHYAYPAILPSIARLLGTSASRSLRDQGADRTPH